MHRAVYLFEIPCSLEHACNVYDSDQKTNVACGDQMDFASLINCQKVTVAGWDRASCSAGGDLAAVKKWISLDAGVGLRLM